MRRFRSQEFTRTHGHASLARAINARFLFAIGIIAIPLPPAAAQAPPEPPQINVSGSAEVKVAPDEIDLDVGVETRHETLAEAKRQNDERVSSALKFLKRIGIEDKDVQTDFVGIEPTYESNYSSSSSKTKPLLYTVQKGIGIRLRKVGGFETVLTGLLTNGVNYVHGIDFRTSQLRKHRDTARQMAIHAAREKAEALAAELGVKRGKVYRINENSWGGWWSWSGNSWRSRAGGGMVQNSAQVAGGGPETTDATLSIGQISVSATVNVSFLIE